MREAAERRQNCLIEGSTGAGKTTVLYSLLSRLKRRALVMVWTGALLDQWRERAVAELGLSPGDVGVIQGGTERVEALTICMQQTIASRMERGDTSLVGEFDVLCCDEVQRMAADTCYAAVDPFSARYRVGVSADHTRHDEKDVLIRDLFGDVAEKITEEETIAAGATVDVEVYVVPTKFRAPWYRYRRDFNLLLEQMTADEERNALALRIARAVVEQGEQVLGFTHRVEHAATLDSRLVGMGIRSGLLLGGAENRTAFQRAAAGFRSGDLRAGVGTYQAIAQGIDLPSVSRGVCLTPIHNNRQQLGQVRGRICRSSDGKDFGRLYVLHDVAIYGLKPVRNFVSWFRTVRCWDGTAWVDGRDWLRSKGARAACRE
jgi:superfamily II DNA or RNA helicase